MYNHWNHFLWEVLGFSGHQKNICSSGGVASVDTFYQEIISKKRHCTNLEAKEEALEETTKANIIGASSL